MERKTFLSLIGLGLVFHKPAEGSMMPEKMFFKDDGLIPNSRYPLLLYRKAFKERGDQGADWLQKKFEENNWGNSWRNGIFDFHHYHSISHEVLGIYSGEAMVHLGGEKGQRVNIAAGDIIVIPAGVGHKNLGSVELGVVGAYPDGLTWDMNYGKPEERPRADNNIAAVPVPSRDPLNGKNGGLLAAWADI
ncbi:cupin [Pollutibacter soli]|uniref:cupin n=1 Tax=Pollutibacter soli TaxID=3034157 RepID=UPI0030139DC1